jgi:hypothetical protein
MSLHFFPIESLSACFAEPVEAAFCVAVFKLSVGNDEELFVGMLLSEADKESAASLVSVARSFLQLIIVEAKTIAVAISAFIVCD